MGTRHLIAAMIDGEYKLAQYGQWDGYPEGQGVDILDFLNTGDVEALKRNLKLLAGSPEDKKLPTRGSIGFAGDSLFCEYAYVIDFDKGVFEIYRGFNHEATPPDSRFPSGADWLNHTDGYEPVKLVQSYELDCLPSKEGFLSDLREGDETDDEAA